MSLKQEEKPRYNYCMTCRNVVKKRVIGSDDWLVQCDASRSGKWHSAVDFEEPENEEENVCPYYMERMMEFMNK